MMANKKKLLWIDYTTSGHGLLASGPWIPPNIFEHVGFETKALYWGGSDLPEDNAFLVANIANIESWQPNIIVVMFNGNWATQESTDEPSGIIRLCARIRKIPNFKSIKIMAFFRVKNISHEQKDKWEDRYDYYSPLPFKIIEHARIAKRLVGEELSIVEGITHYLSANGAWSIYNAPMRIAEADGVWVGAKGKFDKVPRTRLIKTIGVKQYTWVKNAIEAGKPTAIAYLVKNSHAWQQGLTQLELAKLANIRNSEGTDCQLLLGVDSEFLEIETEKVIHSVRQVYQNGGWRIFLIDHMWAENKWLPFFDNLFYEKAHLKKRTIDYAKIISL